MDSTTRSPVTTGRRWSATWTRPRRRAGEYLTGASPALRPPHHPGRSGEFDRYRRRMVETGQRADGQFKVLRLTSDVSFAAEFTTNAI